MYRESLLALKQRVVDLTEKLKADSSDLGTRRALYNQKCKYQLYVSQRGKCCFCDRKMVADVAFKKQGLLATLEHVHPRSMGGPNKLKNYKLSCSPCNSKRGVRDFNEFLRDVKAHMKQDTLHFLLRTNSVRKKVKENVRLAKRNHYGFFQFSMDSAVRFYGTHSLCFQLTSNLAHFSN